MDIELINLVKKGDSHAYESILNKYRPLINKIISVQAINFGDYKIDTDELIQVAQIGLYEAIIKYSQEKGMNFSSFVYLVINNRIITYYKNSAKVYSNECYSLNVDHNNVRYADRISDSSYDYYCSKQFENKIDEFINSQNEEDKQILLYRKQGIPVNKIAKLLDTNAKRINNRIYLMKKKFKSL